MAQVEQTLPRRDTHAAPYRALREKFVAARKAAGLTQEALAGRIGRSQSFIAKLERGERSLDVVELVAIGRVINLDIPDALAAVEAEL